MIVDEDLSGVPMRIGTTNRSGSEGTAYISDLGMTGPWDSILGVKKDIIIQRFLTALPARFDVAEGPSVYAGILLTIEDSSNRTMEIERIFLKEEE